MLGSALLALCAAPLALDAPAPARAALVRSGPARSGRDAAAQDLPLVRVEADDTVVDRSCRLVFADEPIADANGDGVVRVVGDDLVIECVGALRGASAGTLPDAYTGVGIVVGGQRNRLVAPRVSGFKVGILVDGAFAARIEDAVVSDNFRQRLGSTWEREDPSDWLWPHANDGGEWLANYGAGLAVRDARDAEIVRLFARDVQNGIVLDRAIRARVRGCDASYLSGWGCALWRCTGCAITGNRFDHCIRGYAHGRYNRGQDSAGVLMFEQCVGNRVIANSITHGGDGVFAFAGKEALGEVPGPPGPDGEPFDHTRRGCNDNVFRFNDLSFAAAHGLELTFSFGNMIESNLLEGNAICGAWLGYSRETAVRTNRFVRNGDAGYGAERGAINAEHGRRLSITENLFEENALDVRLWTDEDAALGATPWARANGQGARDNWIVGNQPGELAIELVDTGATATDVARELVDADEASRAKLRPMPGAGEESATAASLSRATLELMWADVLRRIGVEPLPARELERGRATIVVGEWGPYDWSEPYLQPLESGGAFARYRLLGPAGTRLVGVEVVRGDVELAIERASAGAPVGPDGLAAAVLTVRPKASGIPTAYALDVRVRYGDEERVERVEGRVLRASWRVRFASWEVDPREDADHLAARLDAATEHEFDALDLDFGSAGPAAVVDGVPEGALEGLGTDRFGTRARCELTLTSGRWRLFTVSDDGLRVRLDDALVIDDWTWHAPKEQSFDFEVDAERAVSIEVEHFELDGWARLTVELRPLGD